MLDDIPKVKYEGVIVEEPYACGAGTYLIQIKQFKETDYDAYLTELQEAGYQLKIQDKTKNGLVRIAILEKGDYILSASFYPTMTKSWMTVSKVRFDTKWDGTQLFQNIPKMGLLGLATDNPVDYGAGNYVVATAGAEMKQYEAYLEMLEGFGFKKYVDNGNGLANAVFSATYTKENIVLTITYVKKQKKLYVSACCETPLSEHLFCNKNDVDANKEGAQTKLHMLELWWFGNSFVIQLKNGHFIISDGGFTHEIGYMLDYLDTLVPKGEKPIVEAWIISHAHSDHCSILRSFVREPEYVERLYVEGLYYNQPNDSVIALDPSTRDDVAYIYLAADCLKTTMNEHPKVYRPQTGQQYYFNDITMDIVFAQEQLEFGHYSGDFNDSSTWCMFHIEGQKCLLGGDGDKGAIRFIMDTYDRDYMKVDLFSLLHHGWNVWDYFTDFCTVKSVLNTRADVYPEKRIPAIQHMKEVVHEWLERADGTKVLSFPYVVGTATCLPPNEWIYHKGVKRP